MSEINVKEIEYISDDSGVLVKKIKPNFRKLGQEYGAKMKEIANIINGFGKEEISQIESEGSLEIDVQDEKINITLEDVEITSEDIPGWLVASEGSLTVALDITLTDELRKEGLSRDVVNRVQNLRKDKGLEVQDKIAIEYFTSDELLKDAVNVFNEYIMEETQALSIRFSDNQLDSETFDIDGLELKVQIEVSK